MAKHKYLSNLDYFSLQFDTCFGLLVCNYTHIVVEVDNLILDDGDKTVVHNITKNLGNVHVGSLSMD
jgi:hypothetical protein